MQMKRIIHIGLWILLGSLPACKKEFTEPVMSRVQFTFDWGKLPPEAQIGENMGIRFYAEDGQVYDMDGDTTSFNGSLPVGTYQVLLRNKPTPSIGFRGEERFETAEAYVSPVSRSAGLVGQPDWLFSAALARCEVTEKKVTDLSVTPKPMVHRITFNVKITDHREIEAVAGCLLNVASALNLSTGQPIPSSAGETDIPIDRSGEVFSGAVLVLTVLKQKEGSPDIPDKNLKLDISFADGTEKTVELDISDQLADLGEETGNGAEVDVVITPEGVRLEVRIIEWVEGKGPEIPIKNN